MDRPIPDDHARYGKPSKGFFTIFDAYEDDVGLDKHVRSRDVFTDGNQVLTRKLMPEEIMCKKTICKKPSAKA